MKIFLDTSDVDVIRQHCETGLIDGVTTNPTLMMKAGRNPVEVIKEISSLFPEDASISAEIVGDTAEEMVSQAKDYYSINKNITIKVPCNVEGLKACKVLSDKSISVNVTLIFSVEQAILAAKAGAQYVSPFVGRLDDIGKSGIDLINDIKKIYVNYKNLKTKILAASIRSTKHITQSAMVGADVVTVPPKILGKMLSHTLTDKGLNAFLADWEKLTSENPNVKI